MQRHQVALGHGANEADPLAGIVRRHALEIGDEPLLAVGDMGIVLDIGRADIALHRLARPALLNITS